MRTIEIVVSPAGHVRVHTRGFTGSNCRAAAQSLEQMLGSVAEEQLTSEYFAGGVSEQLQQRCDPS